MTPDPRRGRRELESRPQQSEDDQQHALRHSQHVRGEPEARHRERGDDEPAQQAEEKQKNAEP
jgi:hypothetical protein